MRIKNILLIGLLVITLVGLSWKETPYNEEQKQVLQDVDLHLGGMIPGVAWDLTLENYDNNKLRNDLKLVVEASTVNDQRFALVSFLLPKKYEGQKLLIRANNMWFTKKGLSQPMAISGRQRLSGAAANADIASATYSIDYNVKSTAEERFNNDDCFVYELEAKNNMVSYARIKLWVSKTAHTAYKAEYYAKTGDRMIKQALFEYGQQQNYKGTQTKFVSKISISDQVDASNKTVLNISDFRFPGFDNSKFDKNNL